MANVPELKATLPQEGYTTNFIKMNITVRDLSVSYYTGRELLINRFDKAFDPKNKDPVEKAQYFEKLDYQKRKQKKILKILDISQVKIQVLIGKDTSLKVPINCLLVCISIGNFGLNFHNSLFFGFLNSIETLADYFSYGNIKDIRPFIRPIT